MKILGKTKDGFILEASKKEVANLIGYYSDYDDKFPRMEAGHEIKVSEMFTKLYELAREEDTIKKAVAQVRGLCDLLVINDPLDRITLKTKTK